MPGRSHHAEGACPVRWLDRHALVTLPERIEQPGAVATGEQLLTIIDGDVRVLILDMTGTTACDHAGGDMLARVYHRAVARGTALRLVAGGEKVLRVLTLTGIDRLVPVHASGEPRWPRVLLPTGPDEVSPPGASGVSGVSGASGAPAAGDRDLVGEMTDRLSGAGRILEESAGQAAAPLAGQLRRAIEELDAIIQAAQTSITPPRHTGEEDASP